MFSIFRELICAVTKLQGSKETELDSEAKKIFISRNVSTEVGGRYLHISSPPLKLFEIVFFDLQLRTISGYCLVSSK